MTTRAIQLLLLSSLGLSVVGCFGKDDTGGEECDTPSTFYLDGDGDGYGLEDDSTEACAAPSGYAEAAGDCDDADATVNPGAEELCNELDDDCDGAVDDEPTDGTVYYDDLDGDGYGSDASERSLCEASSGLVTVAGDCDDSSAEIHPEAEEICDGVDNDCDGLTDGDDDDVPTQIWYRDDDGDGYGENADDINASCPGSSYALEGGDCDDEDATINPGADEIWYDGVDQNCDEKSDYDQDYDRYKAAEYDGSDCDDTDPAVNPAAEDVWYDGVDQDCDEHSDYDQDYDGYDSSDYGGTDCDDADDTVHPDQPDDDGDGVDTDCNGAVDDDLTLSALGLYYQGENTRDGAGGVLAGGGDLDGDGLDDFAVGVALHNAGAGTGSGAVYVVLGASVGGTGSISRADLTIDGAGSGMQLGTSVDIAGDVNGDGYDDLVVGAPNSSAVNPSTGDAFLFLGGPHFGGLLDSDAADVLLHGTLGGSLAGTQVQGVGDVTGDGLADLLVSAPAHTVNRGKTFLISDPQAATVSLDDAVHSWLGESADDYCGRSLANAGDTDGDGVNDLLFGSYINDRGGTEAGSAYLVLGPGAHVSDLEDADGILYGEAASDRAGYALDGAGDVDGDGYDDLLIGAYKRDAGFADAGAAYIVLGPFSGVQELNYADAVIYGPNASAYLGYAVAGAGDVDGDGNDDVIVGAYGESSNGTNAGSAYLVHAPSSGSIDPGSEALQALGASGSYAGYGVSGAGDLDGDGSLDWLVGAKGYSSESGAIYVLMGPW
jgi:hypothetical protein